ncbi:MULTISPECIES: DegT/DnrJ/EryC1/StrS aminotransferase family protein [unclassified Methanoregula]|uniref:DegT/DnrJ/EryC1/StrS family aminotransferase n=1 Tax=unclassified Methanoregula TaxID=2649730 RepID=UPI0009CAD445|nr:MULTISPECIES: DegT/DnrJ/EryC1/StrS family aminotransferase [unclassified Methanoregula]OPX65545.1 MAG: UDP-4-amino-4-deoxy-L-arabinose--oxoglutarate aminotransferase [Methanoregula sp. PtaB.Bin085]OPY35824.1 MAG: UDP-4-amino-4-deoxy-L-arabinose--oxoglutarate aminotransferase [Methanoregula sp. PtaU1.Bin006]
MIPVARPAIGQEEISAVTEVLKSGMLASGERVAEFETKFADLCGSNHAVAVNNGTAALHAALLAAGIGPGDEVIVPAFTFVATASAVAMCGARPVFADVDEMTFNIDPAQVAEKITQKTRAVIGVHLFGQPCDIEALQEICEQKSVKFIEDAAQAQGAMYKNGRVGSFGHLACFSFYATKNMITGEGGMVTTNDKGYNQRLRLLINHGQSEKYLHTILGYNYRMTDIAAALGLVQLRKLEKFNLRRRKNAEFYNANLSARGLSIPFVGPSRNHVYHQYVVRLREEFPLNRQAFMDYLKGKGIGTAIHYPIPLHRQPLFSPFEDPDPCPVASALAGSVMSIPVHPLLDQKELGYICDTINRVT